MAVIHGVGGNVSVSSASDLKTLLETGMKPNSWTINYSKAVQEVTGFGATTAAYASSVYNWTATITGTYSNGTPRTGVGGLVTWSSGYTTNAVGWTMDITWPEVLYTPFDASGAKAQAAIPGVPSWAGTIEALLDDSVAVTIGTTDPDTIGTGTGTSATFKLAELGATDDTLAGSIIVTGVTPSATATDIARVTIAYQGTGNLTAAGSTNLFAAAALGRSSTQTIVFTQASGRTYTGSAFLTGVSVQVRPEDLVAVTATVRGSGVLTPA